MARTTKNRQAFTLIELLVAMALTVFVMTILSQAFIAGLDTFRGLKAIGDMQENLRVATTNLRSDLAQDHFEGKRRISDPHLWAERPRNGFVVVYQGSSSVSEGAAEGIPSLRALNGNHILHMLVKRKGNRAEDFFAAPVPAGSPLLGMKTDIFGSSADATWRDGNVFKSQWAEVAYFLVRTGTTQNATDVTSPPTTSVPVYNLYRLELTVVPDSDAINAAVPGILNTDLGSYRTMCCYAGPAPGNKLYFPSPSDLVDPAKRTFNPALVDPTKATFSVTARDQYVARASLVMSDVITFNVQAVVYVPKYNLDIPVFKDLSSGVTGAGAGGVFDTGAPTPYRENVPLVGGGSDPSDAVIKGLSVTIRCWDRTIQQARQVTLVQDM